MASSTIRKLENHEVGELYRHYQPLQGKDPSADLVLALIRKLVHDQAMAIPYGDLGGPPKPPAAGLRDFAGGVEWGLKYNLCGLSDRVESKGRKLLSSAGNAG